MVGAQLSARSASLPPPEQAPRTKRQSAHTQPGFMAWPESVGLWLRYGNCDMYRNQTRRVEPPATRAHDSRGKWRSRASKRQTPWRIFQRHDTFCTQSTDVCGGQIVIAASSHVRAQCLGWSIAAYLAQWCLRVQGPTRAVVCDTRYRWFFQR